MVAFVFGTLPTLFFSIQKKIKVSKTSASIKEKLLSSKLKGEVTYFVLFMIELFTSLHCVGMCGGIILSQSISFTGKQEIKEIKEIDFQQDAVGTFGNYKDRKIVGVIEVVENLDTTDLEKVRAKFL